MFVHIAVPVPQLDLLTYSIPDDEAVPAVGARAVVPLGTRVVTGIVVAVGVGAPEAGEVRPIRQLLDRGAFVPPEVVALAQWVAEYYASGVGAAIPMLLPPMARGGRTDAHKTRRMAAITAAGLEAVASATGRQREALELLGGAPDGIATAELATRGIAAGVVSRLAQLGHISVRQEKIDRDPFALPPISAAASDRSRTRVRPRSDTAPTGVGHVSDTADRELAQDETSVDDEPPILFSKGSLPSDRVLADTLGVGHVSDTEGGTEGDRQLTEEQDAALARLLARAAAGAFHVALLHGVTGSGKTEIYLRLAAAVRDAGRRVLMLVPEIALTPAAAAQFRAAFGDRVAIQHSGLSDGERHDQWQRIRRGDVDVVVGTRSAVFAPLERVGLIVVDEEHDPSYKQEESPRYNGRDVAIVRGRAAGALVVLGSATPSLESYHNAMTGKYERIVLERRVLNRPLADVTVVDMREEYAAEGPDVVLSRALRDGIARRLAAGEQALVLLNRRGFATAIFCRQCAGTLDCPNCSVSLVVHGEGHARRARCHYCNYTARVPPKCPLCAGPYLEQTGIGTERVEAEVKRLAPGARVGRLDRDAIRRKGSLQATLAAFQRGDIDILVGTQMIAKGHDFPRVTLVGVVSADVGLGAADFRASERTFQLLTQVAGRAGRGEQRGEAIVQTLYPDHYSIQLACRQDFVAFYEREMHFRRTMHYPPIVSLVNTVVRGRTFTAAMDDASAIVEKLREDAAAGRELRVLGPAPPPLGKLRGEYRAQLLIKSGNRRLAREALQRALAARPDLQRRVVVDIDPLSVT